MYSAEIIDRREQSLLKEAKYRSAFPEGIPRYSVRECRQRTTALEAAADEEGQQIRPFTDEEDRFVTGEGLRVLIDAPYWLERYVKIDDSGHGLKPLYPLWESQDFLLRMLAKMEEQRVKDHSPDGLLLNVLKIRQVGITTLGVALVCHRMFTRPYIRALVGSDMEAQAAYLFRIAERVYRNLPWWLKPQQTAYNKNREMMLDNLSELRTAWGKTTRGALQEVGGKKGNIERGRTYAAFHISELATWDNPDQLDSALLPGIPIFRDTLGLLESTAELSDDWWHKQWRVSAAGQSRFRNLFIGAYAVPSKYALSPPERWEPKDSTKAWEAKAIAESPQWCLGQTIRPTREQQYWYETTRGFYESKDKLHEFLKEYPSDPEECTAGDTRISTNKGIVRIDHAQDITAVESGQVTQWWDRGERMTWKVTTKAGREFSATAEHLTALTNGAWKPVVELQPGDVIALEPPQFLVQDYYRATWQWAPCCSMAVAVKEDFGKFLGFFLGDGSWGQHTIDIACCRADDDVVQEVQRLLDTLIGGQSTVTIRGKFKGGASVRSSNVHWREICLALGLLDKYPSTKSAYKKRLAVPECIWRSPKSVVAAFLSGLFESDGHAHKDGPRISFFTKSPAFMREVQLLLLSFGINAESRTARKRNNTGKEYLGKSLVLNAQNAEVFYRDIGFIGARKRSMPSVAVRKRVGRASLPLSFTDVVVSVVPDKVQPVYDLGVLPTHYFGANGIRVHNCFQYAGTSIFTVNELARIDQQAKPLIDIWKVEPARDIAELKRFNPDAIQPDSRRPAPMSARVSSAKAEAQLVPEGYGFRRLGPEALKAIEGVEGLRAANVLLIYEYPRLRSHRHGAAAYVMSVDVADGVGLDYSVIDVYRMPTIEESTEQVAQFVSNSLKPVEIARIADAMGRFYCDEDGIEALAAVESNIGPGLVTQSELQLHLGYSSFYVWEILDAGDMSARYTKRIGWATTQRTRPIILSRYHEGLTTTDPITGLLDLRVHSPISRAELRHLIIPKEPGARLGDAVAAPGHHDDCVMSGAIGNFVAYMMMGGESEPIHEKRHRRAQMKAIEKERGSGFRRDYRNSAITAEAMNQGVDDDDDSGLEDGSSSLYFDPRACE